jgi:hypothetical protein
MPISGFASEGGSNDFQHARCGGTKLLPEFTLKIGMFSIH